MDSSRKLKSWQTDAIALNKEGHSWRWIAKYLNKPKSTISDFLRKEVKGYVKPSHKININKKFPKILIIDIETAPMKVYVWSRWNNNISPEQVINESFIITWAAGFLDEDIIYSGIISKEDCDKCDDSKMILPLIKLMNEADIIVGHYIKRFDILRIKSAMIKAGLSPLLPFKIEDTKEIAAREFGFSSNKLVDLCNFLGIENKMENDGFPLWKNFLKGDDQARDMMLKYNRQDIIAEKGLYLKLRAWDSRSINKALFVDDKLSCPSCASKNLYLEKDKTAKTQVRHYPIYVCKNCGKVSRSRDALPDKIILANVIN